MARVVNETPMETPPIGGNNHLRRVYFEDSRFASIQDIFYALQREGYSVVATNHKDSVCKRTGELRKGIKGKGHTCYIHVGNRDNSTEKEEDSLVIRGEKGWKYMREDNGELIIDELENLIRKPMRNSSTSTLGSHFSLVG